MSVISAIANSNKTASLEAAFEVKDITSMEMKTAIQTWFELYFQWGTSPNEDDCQRLPVLIVNKLYKAIFSEYTVSVGGVNEKFLSETMLRLNLAKKKAMQMGLVGGQCLIKPVIRGENFDFVVVRRDSFIPLASDACGKLTSAGCTETTAAGGKYYTLAERRTVTKDGTLTIENRLYVSGSKDIIGTQVQLSTLDKYANLEPEIRLPGIYNLGMIPLRTPLQNCVDGSDDPVSVYAPAVGLIKNINRNERQLDDEFDNGASRIIASADLMEVTPEGRQHLNSKQYAALDDDPENVGITIFSPELREASYLARKQEYLRNIESLIGLKRGILSEVEAAERTATEITSSAGDYNLTILDFQECWEDTVRETLATCARLGQLYKLCGSQAFDPEKDLAIDWGDGALFNRDKVWAEYQTMVSSGMLKPELALAWYFNLPHETPADLAKIRENYMPEMESLLGGE